MKVYRPEYEVMLKIAHVGRSQLEDSLQALIEKFERALHATQQAETSKQDELLKVLVQADAVICWQLHNQYNVMPEQAQQKRLDKGVTVIDKTRVMALKAKALQLKWRNREEEKIKV